jgi:hypothetical protein
MMYQVKEDRKPWNDMLARARELGKTPRLDVGFPAGGTIGRVERKGSGHKAWSSMTGEKSSEDVAYIMSVHEKGSVEKNIPARPFMQPAIDKNINQIKSLQAEIGDAVLKGQVSLEAGMNLIGRYMSECIKQEIRQMKFPPLKPETIKRKGGRTNLLDDTGQAINSVTWVLSIKEAPLFGRNLSTKWSDVIKDVNAKLMENKKWGNSRRREIRIKQGAREAAKLARNAKDRKEAMAYRSTYTFLNERNTGAGKSFKNVYHRILSEVKKELRKGKV